MWIVTCCNRKFRMTHIFWFDQYKKGFSFIFLTKRKDDSSCLAYVKKWWWENFPLDTIFLSKLWQVFWKLQLIENDDQTMIFFHKKFETLRKDHLVSLMKKFCYTHYSLYQKSFTHIFIQVRKLRVLLHIGTLRSLINR